MHARLEQPEDDICRLDRPEIRPCMARGAALKGLWASETTSLVSVAKRPELGAPIQVMPMDWAQNDRECRDRQAPDG